MTTITERELASYMKKRLKGLEKTILELLSEFPEFQDLTPSGIDAVVERITTLITLTDPSMKEKIEAVIKARYVSGFNVANQQLKRQAEMSPADHGLQQKISEMTFSSWRSLTDEMKADIRSILLNVIQEGKNPRDAIPRIKNVFNFRISGKEKETDLKQGVRFDTRAEQISRTGTIQAYNAAHQQQYEASGTVWGKKWSAAHDERTCPICGGLDNKVVKIDESFKYRYKGKMYEAAYAPIHINCRCRIIPISYYRAEQMGLS